MKIPIYIVDAFTKEVFKGNPAAVCPLPKWVPEDIMQKIAFENNLAETAFFVKEENHFYIRWFTPTTEVKLCGHATLATAHVLIEHLGFNEDAITFDCKSGLLKVNKVKGKLQLDFPKGDIKPSKLSFQSEKLFGIKHKEVFNADPDLILVFENENEVLSIKPDLKRIADLPYRGINVTAPGIDVDFVSRFFAPGSGIDEDPVTGSAHTNLTPLWAKKLNKSYLTAKQVSPRGGDLICELAGERVLISGNAVTYSIGEIIF